MSALPPFLLFDLDDTILDYSASGRRCWQELCQAYAPRFGIDVDRLQVTLRQSSDWYWSDSERHRLGRLDLKTSRRRILHLTLEKLGVDCYALGDEMADAFTVQREERALPFPGATEALQEFQQLGIRMGLVTNGSSEFQRNKIRRFDLARYFEAIVIEGEYGAGKPNQSMFLYALERLGAAPAQTWMVGDDLLRDIRPAQLLGLGTVWVDCDGSGLPADSPVTPGRIVQSLADLSADLM